MVILECHRGRGLLSSCLCIIPYTYIYIHTYIHIYIYTMHVPHIYAYTVCRPTSCMHVCIYLYAYTVCRPTSCMYVYIYVFILIQQGHICVCIICIYWLIRSIWF